MDSNLLKNNIEQLYFHWNECPFQVMPVFLYWALSDILVFERLFFFFSSLFRLVQMWIQLGKIADHKLLGSCVVPVIGTTVAATTPMAWLRLDDYHHYFLTSNRESVPL